MVEIECIILFPKISPKSEKEVEEAKEEVVLEEMEVGFDTLFRFQKAERGSQQ